MKEEKENNKLKVEVLEESIPDENMNQNTIYGRGASGGSDGAPNDDDLFNQNPYLPTQLQKNAENVLGQDFSNVNIYKDSKKAKELGAKAFAQGDSIHFAEGKFNPNSVEGQELIAHELVHVAQQRNGELITDNTISSKYGPILQDESLENESKSIASIIRSNGSIQLKSKGNSSFETGSNFIQMDPEVLDEVKYKTIDGVRIITLNIDSNGDQIFDTKCRIELRNGVNGKIFLQKTNAGNNQNSNVEIDFTLNKKLTYVSKEFYHVNQIPVTSLGAYELQFANNHLTLKIDDNNIEVQAKEQLATAFDAPSSTSNQSYVDYTGQHPLSASGSRKESVFLSERFMFRLAPFNDKISMHFLQGEIRDNGTELLPKVAVFADDEQGGSQRTLKPIYIKGLSLDKVTDYKYEKVDLDRAMIGHKITFISPDGDKEIFISAYITPVEKNKELKEKRKINFEVSNTSGHDATELNKVGIPVEGLPGEADYKVPKGERNIRQQRQFNEAASLDAETRFKKAIQFENAIEKRELEHYSIIVQNIKKLAKVELNDSNNHIQSVLTFFRAWDAAKEWILSGQSKLPNELKENLKSSTAGLWNSIHEIGIQYANKKAVPVGKTGGISNPTLERVSRLTFNDPSFGSDLENTGQDLLGLFDMEIQITKTLYYWYQSNTVLAERESLDQIPLLKEMMDNVEIQTEKSTGLEDIKSGSVKYGEMLPIGGGVLSDFHTSRALFYPGRQESSKNIMGIPIDITVYLETSLRFDNKYDYTWHVRTYGINNNKLHKESIDVTQEKRSLKDCHKEVMMTLDDSDFSSNGKLFYQLIPEDSKGNNEIVHGNVDLKGTDDNQGIFGSYSGYANMILTGASLISALTPFGPAVFAITSSITALNSIVKTAHSYGEGRTDGREISGAVVDIAAAIFDIGGAVRTIKKLTFETIGLTINSRRFNYLKFVGPHATGILADIGSGVLISYDTYQELKKLKEEGNLTLFEGAKVLSFFFAQGAMFAASGYSKVKDLKEIDKFSKLNQKYFGKNTAGIKDYSVNVKPTATVKSSKIDPKASERTSVKRLIAEYEESNGSWLRDRSKFKAFVEKKNLPFNDGIVDQIERQQKLFILNGVQNYGESKFRELTKYMKDEKVDMDTFDKLLTEQKISPHISNVEMAFLHKACKGNELKIKNFLNDKVFRDSPVLLVQVIKKVDDLEEFVKLRHTSPSTFYNRTLELTASIKIKGVELEVDELLEEKANLNKRLNDIKTDPNFATKGELLKMEKELQRLKDSKDYLDNLNLKSEREFQLSEREKSRKKYQRDNVKLEKEIKSSENQINTAQSQIEVNEDVKRLSEIQIAETYRKNNSTLVKNKSDIRNRLDDDVQFTESIKTRTGEIELNVIERRFKGQTIAYNNLHLKEVEIRADLQKAKHNEMVIRSVFKSKSKLKDAELNLKSAIGSAKSKNSKLTEKNEILQSNLESRILQLNKNISKLQSENKHLQFTREYQSVVIEQKKQIEANLSSIIEQKVKQSSIVEEIKANNKKLNLEFKQDLKGLTNAEIIDANTKLKTDVNTLTVSIDDSRNLNKNALKEQKSNAREILSLKAKNKKLKTINQSIEDKGHLSSSSNLSDQELLVEKQDVLDRLNNQVQTPSSKVILDTKDISEADLKTSYDRITKYEVENETLAKNIISNKTKLQEQEVKFEKDAAEISRLEKIELKLKQDLAINKMIVNSLEQKYGSGESLVPDVNRMNGSQAYRKQLSADAEKKFNEINNGEKYQNLKSQKEKFENDKPKLLSDIAERIAEIDRKLGTNAEIKKEFLLLSDLLKSPKKNWVRIRKILLAKAREKYLTNKRKKTDEDNRIEELLEREEINAEMYDDLIDIIYDFYMEGKSNFHHFE